MTSASKELEQEVSESFHYLGYGGWVACVEGPNCWGRKCLSSSSCLSFENKGLWLPHTDGYKLREF